MTEEHWLTRISKQGIDFKLTDPMPISMYHTEEADTP